MEIVFFKIQVEIIITHQSFASEYNFKADISDLKRNHATEFNTMKHLGYLALGVAMGVDPDRPASSDPQ